tara:strand:- start:1798 stop:2046 length:249 start_codon:yes stop_codon:yes gene_type:complete
MFECKQKPIEVAGKNIVIQELSGEQLTNLGESAEDLVVAGLASPVVDLDQVKRWPASIIMEIAKEVSKLNGFNEGNGSTPSD